MPTTPSEEEMPDGPTKQIQEWTSLQYAGTAYHGLPQKRLLEEDLYSIVPRVPTPTPTSMTQELEGLV